MNVVEVEVNVFCQLVVSRGVAADAGRRRRAILTRTTPAVASARPRVAPLPTALSRGSNKSLAWNLCKQRIALDHYDTPTTQHSNANSYIRRAYAW